MKRGRLDSSTRPPPLGMARGGAPHGSPGGTWFDHPNESGISSQCFITQGEEPTSGVRDSVQYPSMIPPKKG